MEILDCTLRDGGYYNNWDFDSEVVDAYLESIAKSKIEYVELGLRNFPKPGFLGAFAYTTENYLNAMALPEGPAYGVMVDAKTILESSLSVEEAINILFVPAGKSKISLVRIAAHFSEVDSCADIAKGLKSLGYIVGYNLMQAAGKTDAVISDKAKQVAEWGVVDVLYFADSLGNMDAKEVSRIVKALRQEWDGVLGIHTHNNMGKGLDNTIAAYEAGVTWLDATVTGMGRGAGNTQTENLLAVLDKQGSKYNAKSIYELVIRYFEPMQKAYGWGSNLLYFLGAQNHIHPTYIQNLLSNTHYGTDEVVGAIDYLSNLEGTTSYNGAVLESALSFTDDKPAVSGTSRLKNMFNQKKVLLLTNGPSTKKYSAAIELYIERVKPVVISLNIVSSISEELIDFYCISHNSKFLSDGPKYAQLNKPIMLPKHRFTSTELLAIECCEIIDYGLIVSRGEFSIADTYSVIPFDITIAYILSILLNSRVESISAVGLDGYEHSDIRQQEMIETLNLYNKCEMAKDIYSLTPTSYPIGKGSIYAPTI